MHDPLQVWSLQQQAEVCNDMKRYGDAVDLCRRALELDVNNVFVYGSLCRARIGQKQFKLAEEIARHALMLDSRNEWLLRMLSISMRFQKKPRKAIVYARHAIELAPAIAETHIELASCYMDLRRYRKSHQHLSKALELSPQNSQAHFAKGYVLIQQRQWKVAEWHFRMALRQSPMDANSLNNLGVCLNNQRKHKDAALAFKSAVLVEPDMTLARSNTVKTVGLLQSNTPVMGAMILLLAAIVLLGRLAQQIPNEEPSDGTTKMVFTVSITTCGVLLLLLGFLHFFYFRKRARNKLEAEDPELLEIYERIKKHG